MRLPILSARGISKRFGSVQANDSIDVDLVPGEIHALLGENGAGKSTLLAIFSGLYRPDAGSIEFDGAPIRLNRPADARAHGIATVHQHFTLAPELTVLENVALGLDGPFRFDLERVRDQARPVLARLGLETRIDDQVRHLALGERQRLEIAKALVRGSRVLLLDEPTSILSPGEVEGLFAILRGLAREGTAIVIVTHKLDEARELSDRITVLRRGRVTGTMARSEFRDADADNSTNTLVRLMFQSDLPTQPPALPNLTGERQLWIDRISVADDRGAMALRDCSLDVMSGEIVGVAGVDGNGQRELVEAIAGLRPITNGAIALSAVPINHLNVAERRERGLVYLTDDRIREGVVADLSVAENLAFSRVRSGFWINRASMADDAAKTIAEWNIDAPGPHARAGDLSGGNIQKLILARELAGEPDVIIANKPTHGLDARTAALIRRRLREQANAGRAVLLIESDLDDLMPISDRILVLSRGQIAGAFGRDQFDAASIGALMSGGAR